MKRKVEYEREDFPQVWKMGNLVQIVYRNRSELYELKTKFHEKDYNPYNEIDMIKGNGGKRVHGKKTLKVIDFTKEEASQK